MLVGRHSRLSTELVERFCPGQFSSFPNLVHFFFTCVLMIDIFHFHVSLWNAMGNMLGEESLVTALEDDDIRIRQMRIGVAIGNSIEFT